MDSFIDKSKEDLKRELNRKIRYGNTRKVKTIIDYATENKIILDLNEKDDYGCYPLLSAISDNNIKMAKLLIDYSTEMVKLLIDYANKKKIILELNKKNEYGCTPLFEAMQWNNIEIFKMLVKYSLEKEIKLIIDENDIEEMISKHSSFCELKNISEINSKFIKLIYFCKNKNIIEVIFNRNNYFLKRFNEFNENKRKGNESKDYVVLEIDNEITKIELEKEKKEKEKIKKDLEFLRIEKEKKEEKKLERKNYIMVKIKNKRDNNETLLSSECKLGNIEEVKKLIHYGMNINKKNKNGDTPLLIACKNGNIELVKYLLS